MSEEQVIENRPEKLQILPLALPPEETPPVSVTSRRELNHPLNVDGRASVPILNLLRLRNESSTKSYNKDKGKSKYNIFSNSTKSERKKRKKNKFLLGRTEIHSASQDNSYEDEPPIHDLVKFGRETPDDNDGNFKGLTPVKTVSKSKNKILLPD